MATLLRVRLKNHKNKWVGKKSTSFAFKSDQDPRDLQLDAHWFVPENQAKVWTDVNSLRRVVRSGRWWPILLDPATGELSSTQRPLDPQTYSRFEVVFPNGNTKTLDQVLNP